MKSSDMLVVAHWSMAISAALGTLTVYLIYGAKLPLSIPALVFLHIFLVVLATAFKVSYVARLAALKQLGREAH